MPAIFNDLSSDVSVQSFGTSKTKSKPAPAAPKTPRLAGIKLAITGAFMLSVVSFAGGYFLYEAIQNERVQRQALEGAHAQVRDKALTLEKSSGAYQEKIEKLERQVKTYDVERGEFRKAIESNRQLVTELQAKMKAMEAQYKAMEEASQKQEAAAAPFAQMLAEDGAAAVEVRAPTPASAPAPVPQVLTVNRKFNFAVISMGLEDGLKIGEAVEVTRDGKVVAELQVEKLYENFAAAAIQNESKDTPLKEGDSVRRVS